MNPTTTETQETPASPATPRRVRRRPGPAPILDSVKGILIREEDPEDFKAHCRSLVEKIPPNCEYDQFIAQLSASNTWRARRWVIVEGSLLDTRMLDQAPQLDRTWEQLDPFSRVALSLQDPQFLNTMRHVRDLENACLRRASQLNREMRTPPKR